LKPVWIKADFARAVDEKDVGMAWMSAAATSFCWAIANDGERDLFGF